VAGASVVIVDWDIQSLVQGGVAPWLTHVRERTMTWFHRLKPLRGLPQAQIEPARNGHSLVEACRALGFAPHEIDPKYVSLGKDGRAPAVEPHVTDSEDLEIRARQAHELARRHRKSFGGAQSADFEPFIKTLTGVRTIFSTRQCMRRW
jgi:hypothetical protein